MSFYDYIKEFNESELKSAIERTRASDVLRVLGKESMNVLDLAVLLSPVASELLEKMAVKAREITIRHFGKAVVLYAPLYLANYCINSCVYCGFNAHNSMERRKLDFDDVERESESIAATGIRHILLLTGESTKHSPVEYISECVRRASKCFTSVSLEVYPLETEDYRLLFESGADGLTIYQEVYNEEIYKEMHPKGPKRDYSYRLLTPERGIEGGMRNIGIGALLGLGSWRTEAFYAGLHAHYLSRSYPDVDISLSLPRMRPHLGGFPVPDPVGDRELVQIMLAFRIFLHHVGITVSTRESAAFRDNLLGLGITRMSAGSVTEVGGYREKKGDGQFEVSDGRSVEEVRQMLYNKGYQPVFKDWQYI